MKKIIRRNVWLGIILFLIFIFYPKNIAIQQYLAIGFIFMALGSFMQQYVDGTFLWKEDDNDR